jgi:hypothetical protein
MEEKEKAAIAKAYENLFDQYANALGRFDKAMHLAITARERKPKFSGLWFNSVIVIVVTTLLLAIVTVLVRILLTLKGL